MNSQHAPLNNPHHFLRDQCFQVQGNNSLEESLETSSEKLNIFLAQSDGCHFRDFTLIKKFTH